MLRRVLIALACLLSLWLTTTTALAQDETDTKEVKITDAAREHFGKGVELLENENGPMYEEAYDAFHRAFKESPSPKILSNIGLCAMALERDGEAIESYERYLAEVPDIDARERAKISADLQTLKTRSAELVISVDPDKAKIKDTRTTDEGEEIIVEYEVEGGELRTKVHAGDHRFELSADAHETQGFDVLIQRGEKFQKNVELKKKAGAAAPKPKSWPKPAPTPSPDPGDDGADDGGGGGGGLSTLSMVGLGVTGALVVATVVVGAIALSAKADYESFQTGGDRGQAEDTRATGETLNIVTDVFIGVTALAAIGTGILIIMDLSGGGGDEADASAIQLTPLVSPELAGAGVTVRF